MNQIIPWRHGTWSHRPIADAAHDNGDLVVTAAQGSDAWRHTSYGFVHASEHALLAAWSGDVAIEVDFIADFQCQFDQAGVFVRVSDTVWLKAGVEYADGVPQLGAVVTRGVSDWSAAPVPDWNRRLVTVRVNRGGDAITVRAKVDDEPFRLVRVAPLDPHVSAQAGPFCCAPGRPGLEVTFRSWRFTAPDTALHA